MKTMHGKGKSFRCKLCSFDQFFPTKHDLKIHKLEVHCPESSASHVCDICNEAFTSKRFLNRHQLTHKGEGKGCPVPRKFSLKHAEKIVEDGDPDDPDAYNEDQSPPGEPRAVPRPDPLHHNTAPQYEGEAMEFEQDGPSQPRPLLINGSDAWHQSLLNSQQSERQQQQRTSEQQRQIIKQQNDIEMLQLKHEESQQQLLTHQKQQEQLIIEQQNDLLMLQRRLNESQQDQQLLTYQKQQQQQIIDQQNRPKMLQQQQHKESHQSQPDEQDLIKQYRNQQQYEEHSHQVDVHNAGQRQDQQHEQHEIFHSELQHHQELQRLPILHEKECNEQLKQQSQEPKQNLVPVENICLRQQHEQQEQHTEPSQHEPVYDEEHRVKASQQAVEQQDHAAPLRAESNPQPPTAPKSVPFLLPSINHLSLAGAEEEPGHQQEKKSEAVLPEIMDFSVQEKQILRQVFYDHQLEVPMELAATVDDIEVDPVLPRQPAPPEPEAQSLDRKKKLLNRYRNQSGAEPVPDQKTKVMTAEASKFLLNSGSVHIRMDDGQKEAFLKAMLRIIRTSKKPKDVSTEGAP